MDTFISKLKKIFKGDIANDEYTLKTYSHDTSLFKIKPKIVVFPRDEEDVENLVKLVNEGNQSGLHLSLSARSAGTDMTGGPLTSSIVVELTKYFTHIREIGNDYAIVEPGVLYRDFEKETLKHNLLLPSYPASREICALGGMIANNAGGEKTLTYGKTEDYVQKIKMILRDGNEYEFYPLTLDELGEKKKLDNLEGEIYRKISDLIDKNYDLLESAKPNVSKNSSGYYLWNVLDKKGKKFDLTKLIVGSQGTLGIIVEAKLRLIKPKLHSRLLVIFLKDMKILADLVNHVLVFGPESFESYDDRTLSVAVKFFPQIVKRLKSNLIILAFRFLPEFWAVLTGGMPKLVLLAEFTGDSDEEVQKKVLEAQKSVKEFGLKTTITKSERQAEKYWVIRRESFNLLRQHIHGMRTAPFIDDIIVKPEKLPEFLPKLYEILGHYDIIYTIAGHVGDGNFHIIPLMDLTKPDSKKIVEELGPKVYKLVFEFKGSMSAEHNDGLIRSPYLKDMYGSEVYRLFEETKNIFDPGNIFNPGKKVGASLSYALDHINLE